MVGIKKEESTRRRKQLKQTNPKEGEKEKQEKEHGIRALQWTLLNSSLGAGQPAGPTGILLPKYSFTPINSLLIRGLT